MPTSKVGRKLCYKCQRWKSLASFNKDTSRTDGKYPYCRACRGRYIKNAKGKVRITDDYSVTCSWCNAPIGGNHPNLRYCTDSCKAKTSLAAQYGLTIQEYKDLLESMEGLCPICRREVKRWNIDHNHETGESYGPVCTTCNTKLLAWSFHEPAIAKRLLGFLENPPIRRLYGPRFISQKKQTSSKWQKARYEEGIEEGEYPKVLHGRYRGKKSKTRRKNTR